MSDHDFEKRVKQKMEELRFRPSDAVWQGVERELRKDKPSRRGWLWIPAALLLLCAGGYYAVQQYGNDKQDVVQTAAPDKSLAQNQKKFDKVAENRNAEGDSEKQTNSKNNDSGEQSNSPSNTNDASTANENNSTLNKEVSTNNGSNVDQQMKTLRPAVENSELKGSKNPVASKNKFLKRSSKQDVNEALVVNGRRGGKHQMDNAGSKSDLISGEGSKTNQLSNQKIREAFEETENELVENAAGNSQIENNKAADAETLAANDTEKQKSDAVAELKTDSTDVAKSSPEKAAKKKAKYKWEWGVNGGAGIANLGDGNFDKALRSTNSADIAMSAPQNSYFFAPQPVGIPRPQASEVKAGFHFSIGAFVRKQFTKRLSVSGGLQYAQYNNTIQTGYRVDSARLVNNGSQVTNVARYYRADNNSKFSNKYHFIEVPVYLHTQLNKSKTIPLYWNIGVTVSQMFSSDALIFDSGTGVYYKDEKFYHNTQVAAGTGFSVGLLSGSKFPVWIGPSARYQATQLFTNQISGKKHLMSASMDIRVRLNHK